VKPQIALAKGYAEHQPEDIKKGLDDAANQLQVATQEMVEKARDSVANPNNEVIFSHKESFSFVSQRNDQNFVTGDEEETFGCFGKVEKSKRCIS
jgi:hypothetical protein